MKPEKIEIKSSSDKWDTVQADGFNKACDLWEQYHNDEIDRISKQEYQRGVKEGLNAWLKVEK